MKIFYLATLVSLKYCVDPLVIVCVTSRTEDINLCLR